MNTVKTMLDIKGHEVYSIGPDATVYQAVELMAAREVGALIVVTRDNYLAGIVSERDYARKVLLKNKSSSGNQNSRNHDKRCYLRRSIDDRRHLCILNESEEDTSSTGFKR